MLDTRASFPGDKRVTFFIQNSGAET